MQQLTAALIGLRHPHSAGHIRTLDCLPEITRIVVWDEDASALDDLRDEVRDTPVEQAGSLAELLGRRDLAFVVAAERNDRNPDLFSGILEAGHHLMAEKPLGRTAADARRVVAAAERADRRLAVFYTNRYNPLIAEARRLVGGGALGALFSLEIRMLTTQVRFRGPDHWLFDRGKAGGGILSWLGCHSLDLMPFLTGDPIVSVAAEVATRGEDGFDVEDTATLSMRLRSGALASLHAAYVLAVAGGGFYNPAGYDQHVGVNGREGRLWWNDRGPPELHLESGVPEFAAAPQRTFTFTPAESRAYGGRYGERLVRDFIAATRGEGPVPIPGEAAVRVGLIVDAAYESARTGRRVEVPAE
ncbi:MAG: Gfo/Idh/MocA family oxidoreductase [Spirochaetaceae bacterium]|nr:Gfo/Idh/MocA family oxidoreductase [Spirochaetaceae bacterium]